VASQLAAVVVIYFDEGAERRLGVERYCRMAALSKVMRSASALKRYPSDGIVSRMCARKLHDSSDGLVSRTCMRKLHRSGLPAWSAWIGARGAAVNPYSKECLETWHCAKQGHVHM